MTRSIGLTLATVALTFGLAQPAQAATVTFQTNGTNYTTIVAAPDGNPTGDVLVFTDPTTQLSLYVAAFSSARAYQSLNASGNVTAGDVDVFGTSGLGIDNWSETGINPATGLNYVDTDEAAPEHAFDNEERIDFMAFQVRDAAGNLVNFDPTALCIGWINTSGDSDFAYAVGTTSNTFASMQGQTLANILSSGFGTVIRNDVANGAGAGTRTLEAAPDISGNMLIVAARYGTIGGYAADGNVDYFKMSALTIEYTPGGGGGGGAAVPEPGSLALAGLGLASIVYRGRRKLRRAG